MIYKIEYLSVLERDGEAIDDYISNGMQPHVKQRMRHVLLDWMSQVSSELRVTKETHHYAVYIVDRYLSVALLLRVQDLQLLGLVALLMACKIEEVRPPSLEVMLSFCLNIYSSHDYKLFELQVAKALHWRLRSATLYNWIGMLTCVWDELLPSLALLNPLLTDGLSKCMFRSPDAACFKL